MSIKTNIYNKENCEELKNKTKNWLKLFATCNDTSIENSDITPYMHVFVSHIWEYVKLYGNIYHYNQEGTFTGFY